ncbi:hypothetical protein SAMN05444679_106129 [Variovorax sp. CF079]|uniref:hypothetical protein n=1 Tax=Variovorax sp. CF079 TaxID=1882774 RepID=UPI0008888AAA|nr:hypothetical protein [Variovorax sp. CF079]SDC92666.1 hypothetical protein SAMN05444679_106129 [Variovorax sp. CF079]
MKKDAKRSFARRCSARARHGLRVVPNAAFGNAAPDILVVPGGIVTTVMQHAGTIRWIRYTLEGPWSPAEARTAEAA